MTDQMIGAEEVSHATGMSKAYSYKLIHRLNGELSERGYLTIPGKVSRTYFESRLFGHAGKTTEGREDVGSLR